MCLSLLAAWVALLGGCIELSPFETDLDDDERAQNARNLGLLARQTAPGGRLRFGVLSDSHAAYDELEEAVARLNARDDLAFVLHLGDLSDLGLRQEYRWTLELLRRLEVPFITAIGNHDVLSNGAAVYREMFGEYNFSFEHAGVRFVVVNSNPMELPDDVPNAAWLRRETRPTPDASTVIVAGHQRRFEDDVLDVFTDNGVAALITGHIHSIEDDTDVGVPLVPVGASVRGHWALVTVDTATGNVTALTCTDDDCRPGSP